MMQGCLLILGSFFVLYLTLALVYSMLGMPGVIAYMLLAFLLMALK